MIIETMGICRTVAECGGLLAQTTNLGVRGSNPFGRAIKIRGLKGKAKGGLPVLATN